jgi:hypothetical protein
MLNYGDISPAVAAYSIVRMLKRAMPYLQLEKFGQTYPLPTNSTQTAKFRRYFLVGCNRRGWLGLRHLQLPSGGDAAR